MQDKAPKKDPPSQKTEEETKVLAFAQTKLNGNACHVCGEKGCHISICPQKESIEHKVWDINKKKRSTNITEGAIVPFAGVHCSSHAGVQKHSHAQKLKRIKNSNMKELILLDSNSNITITRNRKHVTNVCGTVDAMCIDTNGGMTVTN